MSVIGLLAITNLSNAIGASLPRISGPVWLLDFVNASIIFILYASIEYTFANMLFRIELRLDKVCIAALTLTLTLTPTLTLTLTRTLTLAPTLTLTPTRCASLRSSGGKTPRS